MTTPVWVLLGFAGWTLLTLLMTIGLYRWARILTGKSAVNEFRADAVEGSDFYRRSMRAHANCVENLPVYAAIVVAARAAGLDDPTLDMLAIVLMGARVLHTLVHIALVQTNVVASVRFALFFTQFICMAWMAIHIAMVAA